MWSVKCSPKLQQFLWKVKSNALGVGESLIRRGIQVDGKCKRCGASGSIHHVMIACPFAQRVWKLAPVLMPPIDFLSSSMEEVLHACTKIINLPPTGLSTPLYPWIFWVLWTSRNQLMFENKSFSEAEMMHKATRAAIEWHSALIPSKRPPSSASPKDCAPRNIRPSIPPNAAALFSDAVWNKDSLAGGLGWIGTDSTGSVLFNGTGSRRIVASALVAEAMALKSAMSNAVSFGLTDVICFSDSKCLIDLLTGRKTVIALQGLLHDLSVLSNSFISISFRFILRVCNEAADRLAKNALFLASKQPKWC